MIYSDPKLSSSPKFFDLVERLKVGPHSAFWHLHHFWYWCSDRYPQGVLKGVSDLAIASAAQWLQEPKAFVDALAAARFIDRIDGALVVHDWKQWQTDCVRKREERKTSDKSRTKPGHLSSFVQSSSSVAVEDVVLVFETTGKDTTWELTTQHMRKWEGIFPGVNLLLEVKKAKGWCDANPTKRKTARGMESFLFRWLERSQNYNRGSNGVSFDRKQIQSEEESKRIENAHKEQKERVKQILGR